MTQPAPDHGAPTAMPLAELLAITVLRDDDEAECRLEIRDDHLNQGLLTHGGALFTLADTALGLAANRPGDPTWVGTSFHLSLYRGVLVGEAVRARATLENASRQLRGYRVLLRREHDDKLVGALTAQLLAAPPVPPTPPTLRLADADPGSPLVRAMVRAWVREDAEAEPSPPMRTVSGGEQPIGLVSSDGAAWVHPTWRAVVSADAVRRLLSS